MSKPKMVLALLALQALLVVPAAAQSPLEKVIGPDDVGDPIVITAVESQIIGKLSKAAGAPMGIELAPGAIRNTRPRKVTGLTVRAALEAITEIDPRYEWREMNGVIVLRTPEAWNRANHPLNLPVQSLFLGDIRARTALSVVAAFLGAPQYRDTQLGDTKRFSLQLDAGTVLDLLNAAVRAHGELAWSLEWTRVNGTHIFPLTVSLYSGAFGNGVGVPGLAPDAPVNVARYLDSAAIGKAALDRIVGIGPNELPLVVYGPYPSGVQNLASATRVPMGIEFLGPGQRPPMVEIHATGRPLRDVLNAMIGVDPRYEWREMDGVIVIRPVAAWNDPQSMLFRIVEPVHLIDVPPQEALARVARAVGYPHPVGNAFGGKLLSLVLPQGTLLDLVNAVLRADGELTWELSPEPPLDGARSGYRHTFTFGVMGGGGYGFGAR
jgi:hypothetical protein